MPTKIVPAIEALRWTPIPGFSKYSASTEGDVRNAKGVIMLKRASATNGYEYIALIGDDGKVRNWRVHVLMVLTFVGPRQPGFHVAHLDGNRANNRLENLTYCTPKENAAMKDLHGTTAVRERHGSAKLTPDAIKRIRENYRRGDAIALAAAYGVHKTTIQRIVRGALWKE